MNALTVAFIPARGGSKGLPGKNLAQVGDRSLLERAIDVAREVEEIDQIVVSSDSDQILNAARQSAATIDRRPPELALDETSILEVVREFLSRRPDVSTIVILQPTSPLRDQEDIEKCLAVIDSAPAAATVTKVDHPPGWFFNLDASNRLVPLLGWNAVVPQRQVDSSEAYMLNGAVYVASADFIRAGNGLIGPQTVAVVMPRERSVDIDDRLDLEFARAAENAIRQGSEGTTDT